MVLDAGSGADSMNGFSQFLSLLWPLFLAAFVLFSVLCFGRVVSLNGSASSVTPRCFPELAGLSHDERRQVLRSADRRAFAGWRTLIPVLCHSSVFAVSLALGLTPPAADATAASPWVNRFGAVLFLAAGTWGARRFEVARIRQCLPASFADHATLPKGS